jgi:hypothetical protein
MGARLVAIVERIKSASNGIPHFSLARLNLKTGKPLSRDAATLPDDPELVAAAEKAANEILSNG